MQLGSTHSKIAAAFWYYGREHGNFAFLFVRSDTLICYYWPHVYGRCPQTRSEHLDGSRDLVSFHFGRFSKLSLSALT